MTLDDLFSEIATNGWLVNNLFQIDSGLWRCNLRKVVDDGSFFSDWAEAPSATEALEIAIVNMAEAEFVVNAPIRASIDTSKAPSLAAALGLTKPKPTITRRI